MPARKKLNVGPLPEQREDYSDYQEDVVRWDRIGVVALVVLIVLIALTSILASDTDEHDVQQSAEHTATDSAESQETDSLEPVVENKLKNNAGEQSSAALLELPANENRAESKPSKQSLTQASVTQSVTKISPEKKVEGDEVSEMINTASLAATTSFRPASVLITNSAIKAAVLNLSTDKGLPGEVIKQSIVMPEQGLIKVMLSTEMHGMKGKKLFHEWYRNGKRIARVKIPVNTNEQASYSSKFIDKHMIGEWQVKVVDTSAEPYILADFEVLSAQ